MILRFPSYAFEMLNETGIKKLTPGDLHRNALTRFKLGSREERNVRARKMQDQFDTVGIDLRGQRHTQKHKTWRTVITSFHTSSMHTKALMWTAQGQCVAQHTELQSHKCFLYKKKLIRVCYIGLYELSRSRSTARAQR